MEFLGFGNHKYVKKFTGELVCNRRLVKTLGDGPGTGLWGYLDKNNKVAINTKFDDAYDFNPETKTAKVFIIDRNPQFRGLQTGWYEIDLSGKIIR